ncbi:MAG: POTRA domain-containing protein, partial [Xanthobacteraceae bacterium]
MRRAGIAVIAAAWLAAAACVGTAAAGGAEQDPAITVIGNRHTGADMVRSFFHGAPDGQYDAAARDAALKALYATGLFADVKISHEGNRILIVVAENPTIGVVAFEGNRKLKDADLKAQVQSKANGPLSRELIQSDVVHILDLYRAHGYFNTRVVPKTIEGKRGDNDRVNLVFEIKEGEKLAVKDIAFTGNAAFSQVKLRGVVKTGTSNPLSFLLNNDIYDADRIENDKDLVRRFYLAHG